MRNVFAPIALGVEYKDETLSYYTMSDKLKDVEGLQLTVQVIDFTGKKLKEFKQKVSAKSNTSTVVRSFKDSELVTEEQKHNTVIHAWLSDNKGKVVSVKDYFYFWPNKLNLPETKIKTNIKYADGKYTVTLQSKYLAKDVFVEIPILGAQYTDNFFNLMPGEKKTIVITSPELKASVRTPISVKHLRETY
jgi:beta-mannosidase